MKKFKLSNISFSLMFVVLLNSTLLGMLIPYMIHEANTSIFISLFISYIIGLILMFFFFKIFDFLPDKNIFEKIEYILPKFLNKIISFIICILVFLMTIIIFFRLTTFISSEFLIETPTIFITLILSLPIIYLLLYDYDVMSRLVTFCIFIGLILFSFNIISLTSQIDLENLKPLINNDFNHLSKSSLTFSIIYFMSSYLMLIIPKDNVINNNKTKKYVFISYTISFISIVLVFFCIVSVLGVNISNLYTYPSYTVLKTINVLSFVKNMQNINILIWVLFMTFTSSFMLLFLKYGINSILKFNKRKLNIISLIFLFIPLFSITVYLLPYEEYINKYKSIYIPLLIYLLLLVIIFIIYIIGKIKEKIVK